MDDCVARAARNNAEWCDAVCRAHGFPGDFREAIWTNRRQSPPFYPNAVTLVGASRAGAQLAAIDELARADIPGEWGVKDSFHALDLGPHGFRVLFEAEWLYRPVSPPPPTQDAGASWNRLRHAVDLAAWEEAWRGNAAVSRAVRVFPAPLLTDENVAVLAARRGGVIVAGVMANRHAGVLGLSNFFTATGGADVFRRGALAAASAEFPALAIVGYEAGADLAAHRALGFEAIGPLRIWVRRPERGC